MSLYINTLSQNRVKLKKPLDNAQVIAEMENTPAYQRRKVELERNELERNGGYSRTKISVDDEAPFMNSNNSYLHDNID